MDSTAAHGIASLQLHSLVLVVAALVMNVCLPWPHVRYCRPNFMAPRGRQSALETSYTGDWVIHQAMARCIEMLYKAG